MSYTLLRVSAVALASVSVVAGLIAWVSHSRGDPALAPYVLGKPPVDVVFTSRSEPASFRAASAVGEGFAEPGVPQWQAREGRLRVLTTSGAARELTWGRALPDGGTLIDVMSPSVSPDGESVVFAGRRDGGRFRLYRTRVSGGDLEQLTGTADDPGCPAPPPLRYRADGSTIPEAERRATDYDDIDPAELPGGTVVFASSRTPDLGGSADRRATQLWIRPPGEKPRMLSASRSNDRWPFVDSFGRVTFTLWSRTGVVIAAGGDGLANYDPAAPGLSAPPDHWAGVVVTASSESFGLLVKVPEPVWRGRATPSGRLAYMTPAGRSRPFTAGHESPECEALAVASAVPGTLTSAPSSLAPGSSLPATDAPAVTWAPRKTADGRSWSLATPSACPPDDLVVSAAPLGPDGRPDPAAYGLALLSADNWPADRDSGAVADLRPLFDDPAFVDSEPAAAYRRAVPRVQTKPPGGGAERVTLHSGQPYAGPAGVIDAQILFKAIPAADLPAQRTDAGTVSAVPAFAPGAMTRVDFYASHRDRFDHPSEPRVRGTLEKLFEAPVSASGAIRASLPTGSPTLLVGVGPDGKVAAAAGAADRAGTRGKFYAFAGDHVSGVRPNGYHFCTGCHAGHTVAGGLVPERVD